jgi:hypothetical protein
MVKIICIVQAHKNKLIEALKLNFTLILHCFKLDKYYLERKILLENHFWNSVLMFQEYFKHSNWVQKRIEQSIAIGSHL